VVELTPEEKAAAKREKIGWAIAYVVATIATSMLGNDIPFFVLMGMQLIKQSPDKLMQVGVNLSTQGMNSHTSTWIHTTHEAESRQAHAGGGQFVYIGDEFTYEYMDSHNS
jgi:hypothetical protein